MKRDYEQFREFLKKVGSGQHTKKDLTRSEAATAARMMLLQQATPAQIGAFMIAHRIKRPTAAELAGMLDAYDELGPKLQPLPETEKKVVVFGIPYDGRTRTAPIAPITALILAVAGVPVIMHGGDSIATKYGVPLIEIWRGLGLDFSQLSLPQVQQLLAQTGLGFVYIPKHFPEAQGLVPYRDQIGKRPPIATLELIWSPYQGNMDLVAGYVHPPTEISIREALKLRGETDNYTLVKGLEGSCDLRSAQTTIIVVRQPETQEGCQYLKLRPLDYGFAGKEVSLESTTLLISQMEALLQGKPSALIQAAIWNGGFYLWRFGICPDLSTALGKAEELIVSGQVARKRAEIKEILRIDLRTRNIVENCL